MSINSLTDVEVRKHVRRRRAAQQQASLSVQAGIPEEEQPGGGEAGSGEKPTPTSNALSLLIKYIPTETITLYVAALSAAPALKTFSQQRVNEYGIYVFFAVFTPVLFALLLLGKRRAAHVKPLATVKNWPWWKNVAATIAFLVWGLAVPGNPLVTGEAGGAVMGFLAIFISTLLSILEQLFDNPDTPATP